MRREFYNPLNLSKDVKLLSGAACFAEIARCADSWDAKAIEDRVKNGAISIDGADPDNGMRRLLRGELPSDRTIERLLAKYPDLEIPRWRDHGLWIALETAAPRIPRILQALETLSEPARRLVVAGDARAPGNESIYFKRVGAATIRALEAQGGLDALLALTAIVRHAEASATMHVRPLSAAASLRIFPRVVGVTSHLFVSWPLLFKRFVDGVWQPALGSALTSRELKTTTEDLLAISTAARRAGAQLPPDAIVAKSLCLIAEECSGRSLEDVADIAATAFLMTG
jgi:hypothetical protein